MIELPEYVVRMAEELDDLEKKLDRLTLFMDGGFDEVGKEKQFLLKAQLNAMLIYRDTLRRRLDICAKECNK